MDKVKITQEQADAISGLYKFYKINDKHEDRPDIRTDVVEAVLNHLNIKIAGVNHE